MKRRLHKRNALAGVGLLGLLTANFFLGAFVENEVNIFDDNGPIVLDELPTGYPNPSCEHLILSSTSYAGLSALRIVQETQSQTTHHIVYQIRIADRLLHAVCVVDRMTEAKYILPLLSMPDALPDPERARRMVMPL